MSSTLVWFGPRRLMHVPLLPQPGDGDFGICLPCQVPVLLNIITLLIVIPLEIMEKGANVTLFNIYAPSPMLIGDVHTGWLTTIETTLSMVQPMPRLAPTPAECAPDRTTLLASAPSMISLAGTNPKLHWNMVSWSTWTPSPLDKQTQITEDEVVMELPEAAKEDGAMEMWGVVTTVTRQISFLLTFLDIPYLTMYVASPVQLHFTGTVVPWVDLW